MPRLDRTQAGLSAKRIVSSGSVCAVRERLVRDSVAVSTQAQYLSRLNTVRGVLDAAGLPLDKQSFFVFLSVATSLSNLEPYRAAVAWELCAKGCDVWANDPDVCLATKGAGFKGKQRLEEGKEKGTITPAMFQQLLRYLESNALTKWKLPFSVCFGAALRIRQAFFIKVGDVVLDDDARRFLLLLRLDKRVTRNSPSNQQAHLKPIDDYVAQLLTTAGSGKAHGEFLFSHADLPYKQSLQIIRAAARNLKWPHGLDYAGPHAFRHGGTREIQKRVEDIVLSAFTQMSPGVAHQYARSNTMRKRQRE